VEGRETVNLLQSIPSTKQSLLFYTFVQMIYILLGLSSTSQVKYILFDLTIENIEKCGAVY